MDEYMRYGLDNPLYSEEQRKLLQEKLKEAIVDYTELAESADESVPLPLYLERTYEQCFMEFFNLKEEIDRSFPYQKSLMEEMADVIDLNKFTPNQLEELEKAFAEGKAKLLSEHHQLSEGWQIPFESVKNYFKSFENIKDRLEIANLNKNGFTMEGILRMHKNSVKEKTQDDTEIERRR